MSSSEGEIPLAISGGPTGTQAVTEDLTAAAAILDSCAASIADCSLDLTIASLSLRAARVDAVPTVWDDVDRALTAVEDARHGTTSCATVETAVAECAEDLRTVAAGYEEAEREASYGLSWWEGAGRFLGTMVGAQVWWTRTAMTLAWKGTPFGSFGTLAGKDAVGDALMPDRLPAVTGVVNRATTGFFTSSLRDPARHPVAWWPVLAAGGPTIYEAGAASLEYGTRGLEILAGEPQMTGVELTPPMEGPAEVAGFEDLISNLDEVANAPHGDLAYDVYGEGDDMKVVVYVPGTEDHGFSDGHVSDWHGNFQQMTTDDYSRIENLNGSSQLLAQTLLAADFPDGAEITLVGHSQGGAAAASVAACAEATDQLNITGMVLVGSPHDDVPNNEDVDTVVIASTTDAVPEMDGRGTQSAPNVTVIIADPVASTDADVRDASRGLVSSHALSTYAVIGAAIDASPGAAYALAKEGVVRSGGGQPASRTYASPTFAEPAQPRPQPNPEPSPQPNPEPQPQPSAGSHPREGAGGTSSPATPSGR